MAGTPARPRASSTRYARPWRTSGQREGKRSIPAGPILSPASAALGRQEFRLMLGHQRVDDLAQRLALDDLRQLVEREVDAVIAHPALREVVGADALGAVARADLAAPLGGAGGVLLLPLMVVESRPQHGQRLGAVAVL